MEKYIGVKVIEAEPQACLKDVYNSKVGDPGYRVKYADGYESWSPAKPFEEAYRQLSNVNMDFGLALSLLKSGMKVARAGWNGKGMWLVMMQQLELPPFSSQEPGAKVNDRTARHIGVDTPLHCNPYIVMWTADGKWQPGWLASQTDMLADDWMLVD